MLKKKKKKPVLGHSQATLTTKRPDKHQAKHPPPEQVAYVPETKVPVVLLLAPNGRKVTLRPDKAEGNLWMLPRPTARQFCRTLLSQDPLTGVPTTF